jgi:hypothetical protein
MGKTSFIIDSNVVAVMINGIGRGGEWIWCKALASMIDGTVVGIMTMLTSMTKEGENFFPVERVMSNDYKQNNY